MAEVEAATTIEIHTIHVKVEQEVLWKRISERLAAEPHRSKYNEGKKDWMMKTLDWYNNFAWDLTVDNSNDAVSPRLPPSERTTLGFDVESSRKDADDDVMDMAAVMSAVCSLVSDRSCSFREIYMRRSFNQCDNWIKNDENTAPPENTIPQTPENDDRKRPSIQLDLDKTAKSIIFQTPPRHTAVEKTKLDFNSDDDHRKPDTLKATQKNRLDTPTSVAQVF